MRASSAETARRADDVSGRAWSAAIQASLCLAGRGGDVELALERLRGAKSDLKALQSPRLQRAFAGLEARLLAAGADHEAAAAMADEAVEAHPSSPGLQRRPSTPSARVG